MSTERSALFVCLGNICRSPIAEGVFLQILRERGISDKWKVDSAAMGSWHVGKQPDHRAISTLRNHNVPYNNRARQVSEQDFILYDYIFGMDEENMADLKHRGGRNIKAKLLLLGDYDPLGERIIRDPYYDSDAEGFEKCFQQCQRCCKSFLDSLIK